MSETNGKRNGKPAKQDGSGEIVKGGRTAKGTFAPGVSGNPSGRPTGYATSIRRELQELLDAPDESDDLKRTRRQRLLLSLYESAIEGDTSAAKLILDRVLPVTLQADVNVNGMATIQVLDVFEVLAAEYTAQGRLPSMEHGG